MGARVVVSLDGEILSEVRLSRPVTLVGRHPECDVVIEHPTVSSRHMVFRAVDRTVYAEDLASTNGTKVNGRAASRQVLQHLDLIEIGRHKLHFFDDARRADAADSAVRTVAEQRGQAAALAAQAAGTPRAPVPREAPLALERTVAIARPPVPQLAPERAGSATTDAGGKAALALRVLAGPGEGAIVALDRPNTMIGRVGRDTALVIRRGGSFFIARLAGQRPPSLNRVELAPGTHRLGEGDVIGVGASTFEVILSR
ncbi:MAG TPA: FHA domain-containing protein [Usitatibacter sp.]|nr:FHA domain-containing protein [Usitatibacter sp.]